MAKKSENKQVEKQKKESKKAEDKSAEKVRIPIALYDKYKSEIAPKLKEQFSYKSAMEVPKLEKIVVNMGVGEAVQDSKSLETAIKELEIIKS